MSYKNFTDLTVYKECRTFRKSVSKIAKEHFPKEEKFLLKSQILDSSRSVTANIAEGHGRFHYQENIQFCRIARGSLTEAQDHLNCAYECDYITINLRDEYKNDAKTIIKMINGYINYLDKQKKEEKVKR